jgi:6,7-dimethyl-8-ribityllumazine synthase
MANDNPIANIRSIEGALVVPPGARFALVASRFNHFIVDRLVEGALDALLRHGAETNNISLVRVPGSWEIPVTCARLAQTRKFDAIIALSAVVRGSTPHFEYIAAEVAKGVAATALKSAVPITFGILTTDTIEQAVDRAGVKAGNKGFDAAVSAVEMVALAQSLEQAGL